MSSLNLKDKDSGVALNSAAGSGAASPSTFSSSTGTSGVSSLYGGSSALGNGNGTYNSTYTSASSVSPSLVSGSDIGESRYGTSASISSRSRPFSMPPAPRSTTNGSSSPSQPGSPTKLSDYSSSSRYGGYIPPRSASPTKLNSSYTATNSSPLANGGANKSPSGDPSGSPSLNSGSFWAQANTSSSAGGSTAPAQLHLGGVKDLKRSSVGALKMMREFASTSRQSGSAYEGDSLGGTRMVVGGGSKRGSVANASLPEGYEGDRPQRPGRMESEDQGEGEIVLPGITTGAEDVHGLQGRIRLAKQSPSIGAGSPWSPGSPASPRGAGSNGVFTPGGVGMGTPLSRTSAAGSLPFSTTSKWMDTQRHLLQAYEYLCHCGEAKEWMEHEVGEELGAVVEMEESMRDGVYLAKLARKFEPQCVPKIFTHPKLQYKHTDNVNYFFRATKKIGLPEFFSFELTDLYEKKNFPKVVYCIHALR